MMLANLKKYAIMSKIPRGIKQRGGNIMRHVKTISKQTLNKTLRRGGCGECQTSCQSACKTSCTVGNQICEKERQRG